MAGTTNRTPSQYWDVMEQTPPEIWPGSQPWTDQWGSFGTIPDGNGFGSMVERTRVSAVYLPRFWADLQHRYQGRGPRFRIGPRETAGLKHWLVDRGYHCERSETVMVRDLPLPPDLRGDNDPRIHAVATTTDLNQVVRLDHLVFNDPILDSDGLALELQRLGDARRLFFIPGVEGTALAAGGISFFPHWALLWGGETHPDYRRQGLYRQVLDARLQILDPAATEFVAVIADDSTSMPILAKMGFQAIGQATVWAPNPHP